MILFDEISVNWLKKMGRSRTQKRQVQGRLMRHHFDVIKEQIRKLNDSNNSISSRSLRILSSSFSDKKRKWNKIIADLLNDLEIIQYEIKRQFLLEKFEGQIEEDTKKKIDNIIQQVNELYVNQ